MSASFCRRAVPGLPHVRLQSEALKRLAGQDDLPVAYEAEAGEASDARAARGEEGDDRREPHPGERPAEDVSREARRDTPERPVQHEAEIGVAALRLQAAPAGEPPIDGERPRAEAVLDPHPFLVRDEAGTRRLVEGFDRQGQMTTHVGIGEQMDEVRKGHIGEPAQVNLHGRVRISD